jgi:hypothetical protein
MLQEKPPCFMAAFLLPETTVNDGAARGHGFRFNTGVVKPR